MNRVRAIIEADYAYKRGYLGKNCTVAVLDTGAFVHSDLRERILLFHDMVNHRISAYDDNGHGTHISGIIAGDGSASGGLYQGVAPQADLIVIKVMDSFGNGQTTRFLEAIDWIKKNRERYHIRLVNVSAGMMYDAQDKTQVELLMALEQLWDYGIVVMTAAGNNGPKKSSITVPGILRTVITVGSNDDTNIQTRGFLHSGYSGAGPTGQCVVKPELLAPGTNIRSCAPKNKRYAIKSGTSMATPVATGGIALLLEKYPHLTPAEVKLRLYERLKSDSAAGSWGSLNIRKLLQP